MGNFSTALSGLQAESVALDTIGNNLANLNTTAYKGQTTSFEDLFYQQVGQSGSGDPIQIGAGTKVSGTNTDFTQGSILPDANNNSSHLALDGNGFFVTEKNGVQSLTRAGDFQLDSQNNLITQDGQNVLGYPTTNGVVNQNSNLTQINLPVLDGQKPQQTTVFYLTGNLNAAANIGATFSSTIQVYDSLGQPHQLTVNYTKTAPNTWNWVSSLPPGDATGTPTNNTGTMIFNPWGTLASPNDAIFGGIFPDLADGAGDLPLEWDQGIFTGVPTITQFAAPSSNTGAVQNGWAPGAFEGYQTDSSGVITAKFSNGRNEAVAQVAVATVGNPDGLTATGNNSFAATAASGAPAIGVAGAGGRGTIDDGALEQSNVNISTEFASLIVAQRAFEADAKTISTFDTITGDVIAMVR